MSIAATPRRRRARRLRPAAAFAAAVLLAGCGSGDGDRPGGRAPGTAGEPVVAVPRTLVHWGYRADPHDAGVRRGWSRGAFAVHSVTVPHVGNPGPVAGTRGHRAYRGSIGWYRRTITVRGGRYVLRFGSAHHRATVWIDGRPAGRHTGAYEAFAVRPRLGPGRHTVVVRVDWRFPRRQRAEGWDRGWFNFGGLNRPATIVRLARSELGVLRVRTRLQAHGRARVTVAVRVRNEAPSRILAVHARLQRGGRTVPLPLAPVRLPHGRSATLRSTVDIPRAALWSPRTPALWDLTLTVPGETVLRRRIGLREVRWDDGRLTLNGRRLVLMGASTPPDVAGRGDAFTAADLDRIVTGLRAIGANATRAQQPLPRELLDRFDAAGILVWQEVGPWDPAGGWSARTPAQRARATDRVRRTVDAGHPHPSIVVWSLGNEIAGTGHPAGQAEWVDATAALLHRLDPTRPVAADLWGRHLPRERSLLTRRLDLLGVTDYSGWYEDPGAPARTQADRVLGRLERLRALLPGKPIVVTEFGAASNGLNPDRQPGGMRYQADLLARRIRELHGARVAGMIVWTLRDFALRPRFRGGSISGVAPQVRLRAGLNEKGIFTYDGRPKPAVTAVRRAFAAVAPR